MEKILHEIMREYESAVNQFPSFHSGHEGYAVLLEELDELKEEVWKNPKSRDYGAMYREALQVAAMAIRFITDICKKEMRE